MFWPKKTIVVGVGISRTNYAGVVEDCRAWLDSGARCRGTDSMIALAGSDK
jgi:hypothetical protein